MRHNYIAVSLGLIAALLLSFSLLAFQWQDHERVKGNGILKTETRSAGSFKNIDASGTYQVYITQGNGPSVKVKADENLLSYIITEVRGNTLYIYTRKGYQLHTEVKLKVYASMKEVEELKLSGVCGLYTDAPIQADRLKLNMSGATKGLLKISATELDADISGATHLKVEGKVGTAKLDVSGAGEINATALETDNASIDASGAAKVSIQSNQKLRVTASGAAVVRYKGHPTEVSQSISGIGKIIKMD